VRHVIILALGDFKSKKTRYLLSTLVLAVSIALVVALFSISAGAKTYVENMLYRVYPADVMIYSESVTIPIRLADIFEAEDYVSDAEGIVILTGLYEGETVTLVGIPLRDVDYFAINLIEGDLPRRGGEAVVESTLGAKPGDRMKIRIYESVTGSYKDLEIKVVGTMSSLLGGFIGTFRLNLVVVPLNWIQQELRTGPFVNALLLTLKDKALVPAFVEKLKREFRDVQVYSQENLLRAVNRVFNALNLVFTIISATALAASSITIFAVMSITAHEKIKETGLLKAMGISGLDILMSMLLVVITMGAVGGALGSLAGYYGALAVRDLLINMGYNFNVPIHLDLGILTLSLAVAISVAVGGAFVPIYRVVRLRPLEAFSQWQ